MGSKEERRNEILSAALEVFIEKGYDKASMDDIVRASGLSKGTLYWYFKNKEALFVDLIVFIGEQFMQSMNSTLAASADLSASDALRNIVNSTAEYIMQEPRFTAMLTDMFLQASQNEGKLQALTAFYTNYIDVLEQVIQQGITAGEFRTIDDTHDYASAMAGAIDGVGLQIMLDFTNSAHDLFSIVIEAFITDLTTGGTDET